MKIKSIVSKDYSFTCNYPKVVKFLVNETSNETIFATTNCVNIF